MIENREDVIIKEHENTEEDDELMEFLEGLLRENEIN